MILVDLYRFYFSIGGDRRDEVLIGNVVDSDGNFALAAGDECGEHNNGKDGDNDPSPNVLSIVALSRELCHQETNLKYIEPCRRFFRQLELEPALPPFLIRCPRE